MTRLLLTALLLGLCCVPPATAMAPAELLRLGMSPQAWADLSIRLTRVAANTSTGTQDITVAGWGQTPKAAIVLATRATVDGAAADHAVLSVGLTDCTNQFVSAMTSRHGVASMEAYRRYATDEVVMLHDVAAATVDGEANIDACISNGIRLNWADNAPASAYLVTAILFAGSDLENAHVGTFTNNATLDGTVDITAPGFQPTDIVVIGSDLTTADSTTEDPGSLSLGVFVDQATDFQGSMGFAANGGGAATSDISFVVSQLYAGAAVPIGSIAEEIEIGGLDAQGFTVTTRNNGSASDWGYLALDFAGTISRWAGPIDTPTATGTDAQTGPGFEPGFGLLLQGLHNTYDSHAFGRRGAGVALGAFTASESYSCAITTEDNVGTSNTQSLCDDQPVNLADETGSQLLAATFSSFDANGWTLNYSAVDTEVKKWVGWAIETAE